MDVRKIAEWLLRIAVAASFLSAVADRFGIWGAPGSTGVAWGAWAPFENYVGKLNWFAPSALVPFLAWAATIAEIVLGVLLLLGWQLRKVALASALLLLSFALTMTFATSIKAPLDYSVFTASAAMLVLTSQTYGVNKGTAAEEPFLADGK